MSEPLSLGKLTPKQGTNFRWTLVAFVAAGLLMAGLVIWQIAALSPRLYCALDGKVDCTPILIALLGNKDHALIASFTILGLVVLCIVVVALGVNIKAAGPGGTSVDIGEKSQTPDTTIAQGDKEIVIPSSE